MTTDKLETLMLFSFGFWIVMYLLVYPGSWLAEWGKSKLESYGKFLLIYTAITLAPFFVFTVMAFNSLHMTGYKVDQKVMDDNMATFVWHDGKIVKSWFDNVNDIDSAFVANRKKQGEDFVILLKQMEEK